MTNTFLWIIFVISWFLVIFLLTALMMTRSERFKRPAKCESCRPEDQLSERAKKCGTYDEIPEGARFLCGSPLVGTVYGNPEENTGLGWIN